MSKKLLALLLALVMIVGSFTSVLAETTAPADDKKAEEKVDEKKDEKAEPAKTEEKTEEKKEEEPAKTEDPALDRAIKVLKKAGFITGYSADSDDFKVEKNVKRSEFASMIVRAKNLEKSAEALKTVPTGFKDVPTNHWANGYIAVAKQQGFVNGYTDGTFRPDRQISYQDMATMLTIALGQAEVGTVYPAGYVVKAQQLGLFNNVNVPAYTDMATRGDVFKMLYNMITSKEFGQRKIVKAIVLENSRVEKMNDDEIVVEVIKVVQEANWVEGSRTKRGDQHKYVLDKDLKLDAEDLLGKVIDLTVNKDDKIVDVTVDKTYNYFEGDITSVDYKKFGLNWNKYSALFDERYASDDERIYRTYLNDKDYKYEDFARKYKEGKYDFARVTVKNGKVIFIDAYQFNDIAPVESVKDGNVYYYDDADNARVKRAADLGNRVTFNNNGKYFVGERKLIAADDVIHFYAGYTKAIVKKDAKTEQKLTDTHRDKFGDEYIVLEDKNEYYIHNVEEVPFRAVYSYEGKEFRVVTSRFDLKPITGRKVKALIALDGSVQLIQSDLAWNDGINAIRQITSYGEVNLLPAKGAAFWSKEGRDTYYYDARVNNTVLHNDFKKDDIVFYTGEGEEGKDKTTRTMGLVVRRKEFIDENKFTRQGYEDLQKLSGITDRYIRRNGVAYRYFENLNAYYIDEDGVLQQVADMAKFVDGNKNNPKLKSYIMSEYDLKKLIENSAAYTNVKNRKYANTYNFLSDNEAAKKVARIVVFTDTVEKLDTTQVYALVTDTFNYTDRVKFVDAEGNAYTVDIRDYRGVSPIEIKEGDIVDLRIFNDSKENAIMRGFVKRFVAADNTTRPAVLTKRGLPAKHAIKSITYRQTYWFDFNDNGEEDANEQVYFTKDTKVFNDRRSGYAQLVMDENNFVEVIRFTDASDYLPDGELVLTAVNSISAGRTIVVADNNGVEKLYTVLEDTVFLSQDGSYIGKGPKDTEAFVTANKNRNVALKFDNVGNLLSVRALKNSADIANDNLDKAEAEIKKLSVRKYANGTTKADRTADLKKAVEDILKANKLDKAVSIANIKDTYYNPTAKGDGKMEVELANAPVANRKVEVKFYETTDAEAAVEKAEAEKKALDALKANLTKLVVGKAPANTTTGYTKAEVEQLLNSELAKPEYAAIKDQMDTLMAATSAPMVTLTKGTNADEYELKFDYTYADNTAAKAHVENFKTTLTITEK